MTRQETPSQQLAARRSKKASILLAALTALLVCSIAGMILGAAARHKRAQAAQAAVITCGERTLANCELNYYYWGEYFYFVNAVGQSTPGFDANVPPDEQSYDGARTWQDYFLSRALIAVRDTVSMAQAAREAGFVMPDDYRAAYERVLAQFAQAADEQGYASVDAYLRASFGPGATEQSFQSYLYDTHLSSAYADELYGQVALTDHEIADYRDLHEDDYAGQTPDEALAQAAEDLRDERYQNLFLNLSESCPFTVNTDAIQLYQPEGLFETDA